MFRVAAASFVPRSPRTGFILAACLIILVSAGKAIVFDTLDPDCFWHLRVAEQLHRDGIGPLVDDLSFGSVRGLWTPYSWLAEMGMKAVWDELGWHGAVVMQALAQGVSAGLVIAASGVVGGLGVRRLRLRGSETQPIREAASGVRNENYLSVIVSAGLAVAVSLPYLSFRPVTFALVLLALCHLLLLRDRVCGENSRSLWLIIPATALLINLHLFAIFVPLWVGALLVGAVWERLTLDCPSERPEADRRIDRYAILLIGCLMAMLLTPMLPGLIASGLHYQWHDAMVAGALIEEMQPFFRAPAGVATGAVLALVMACAILNRNQIRAGERLLLLLAIASLFRMARLTPVFALTAGPVLVMTLPQLSDRPLRLPVSQAALAAALIGGICWIGVSYPPSERSLGMWLNQRPHSARYPCSAADFVAHEVRPSTGRLINEFTWGGYLEWRLGDRFQTLLDGRTQVFSGDFWRATYLNGSQPRRRFLANVEADAAILPASGSAFRSTLLSLGWKAVYRDDTAVVLLPPRELKEKPSVPQLPSASLLFGD